MDATPEELEAIGLRFHMQHPDVPADEQPTPEQAAKMLDEIRAREDAIEGDAFQMLRNATYNPPSYSGLNSRYTQSAFLVLLAVAALMIVVVVLVQAIFHVR